jgi:hypothetical protein
MPIIDHGPLCPFPNSNGRRSRIAQGGRQATPGGGSAWIPNGGPR